MIADNFLSGHLSLDARIIVREYQAIGKESKTEKKSSRTLTAPFHELFTSIFS